MRKTERETRDKSHKTGIDKIHKELEGADQGYQGTKQGQPGTDKGQLA